MQRYWDGKQWTEHRAPAQPEPQDRGSGVLIGVSYAAALLLPIVGFILGIVLLVRRETGHGLAVFLISIAMGFLACQLLVNDAEEELNQSIDQIDRQIDQDQQELRAYDNCLEENSFRFSACRELDPLR